MIPKMLLFTSIYIYPEQRSQPYFCSIVSLFFFFPSVGYPTLGFWHIFIHWDFLEEWLLLISRFGNASVSGIGWTRYGRRREL